MLLDSQVMTNPPGFNVLDKLFNLITDCITSVAIATWALESIGPLSNDLLTIFISVDPKIGANACVRVVAKVAFNWID